MQTVISLLKCVDTLSKAVAIFMALSTTGSSFARFYCLSLSSCNFSHRYLQFCWLYSSLKWYIRRFSTVFMFPYLNQSANYKEILFSKVCSYLSSLTWIKHTGPHMSILHVAALCATMTKDRCTTFGSSDLFVFFSLWHFTNKFWTILVYFSAKFLKKRDRERLVLHISFSIQYTP